MTTQLVRITNDVEIPLIQYKGQPVLTFALVDKAHGRKDEHAGRTFRQNRKHFIEGEDYYHVDFANSGEIRRNGISVPPRGLIVITESGYLMLVKSFTDDLAWQVQRQLVKVYFRARQAAQTSQPHEAHELMTASDMGNLTRLVWLMSHHFRHNESVTQAIWRAFRACTNTPSPQRFQVRHIPLLAAEARRLFHITRAVADLTVEAETAMVRRIIRKGENAEKVIEEIRLLLAKANDEDLQTADRYLGKWVEHEIKPLIERKPSYGGLYPECLETLN